MGNNVRFVDYSNNEIVCSSYGICEYLDSYMTETPTYTIGRDGFLEMFEELIRDMLDPHLPDEDKELQQSYKCFEDLAEMIVKKTGLYPTNEPGDYGLYDVIDLLIW